MSELDIVPEMLDKVAEEFKRQFRANKTIINIWGKIKSKEVSYQDANEFAIQCGEMLANSYKKFISVETLPEGRMWFNIASRILTPTLHTNYSLITDVCKQAQTLMNEKLGIGLKAITPEINMNRVNGLIDKVSNAEHFEDVEWVLQEPIVNISQSMVDEYMEANAEFHYKSGLTPKVVRKVVSGCCEWCANLAGEYEYPYVPRDVYRRHENCRCTVEYIDDEKKQNVWNKENEYFEEEVSQRKEAESDALRKQEKAEKQRRKDLEEYYVNELLKAHPDWSRKGAVIYYRTNIAKSVQ